MKKTTVSIFLAAILIFSQISPAFAAVRRVQSQPQLSIQSGIAYCYARYTSTNSDDNISLVLTLTQGSTVIESWSATGKESVSLSKKHPVAPGKTYTLTISTTVNGKAMPDASAKANI